MENSILYIALTWALGRLNERSTWVGWIAAGGAKLGLQFTPEFDTLLVNAAIALVALAAYAIKGGPVVVTKK